MSSDKITKWNWQHYEGGKLIDDAFESDIVWVDKKMLTYSYTVKERGNAWQQYVANYPEDPETHEQKEFAANGETITNNLTSVDLQIIKIDETTREQSTPTKLQGAQFQLFKYTVSDGSSTGSYTVYPNESGSVKTTDTDGTLSFEGLPDGQYKISEKKPPDGYLKTGNNDIYFDIVQGTVTRYGSEYSGSERVPADAITGEANMITYESDKHAFIVGNTPGTELPKTGGIGTTLFTALGGLMMGTAGAILTLRKKKTKA